MVKKLDDGDYALAEQGLWLEVGTIALRITRADEGVSVTAYPNGREMENPIAEMWVLFSEGESE